jgi:hypothetical protein
MKNFYRKTACVLSTTALLFALLNTKPVRAQSITLDFNSLPSAQGWTYVAFGNNVPETAVFSASGGMLHQNTIGVGFAGQGSNAYQLYNAVAPTLPFTLTVRARVLQEGIAYPGYNNPFGFDFSVFTGTEGFLVGLGTNQIMDGTSQEITFDNTQFHDYRLEGTPGSGYKLFVDDALVMAGPPRFDNPPLVDQLFLGDGTGGTNARADVAAYTFSQSRPAAVPEPGALGLLARPVVFGAGLALRCLRRKR